MNRDIGWLLGPIVAIALLAVVLWHTASALRDAGAFSRAPRSAGAVADDPYVALDRRMQDPPRDLFATAMRDPFGGPAAAPTPAPSGPTEPRKPSPPRVVVPPTPALPTLTAIISDDDPRAMVRWQGAQYTVRVGGLFDVFEVLSISRDQVVLRRGDERIVLNRPQGD